MVKSRAARAERTGQCATSTRSTRSAMPSLGSSASHTNRAAAFEPVSAIFPGHMAPIIKQSEDAERELVVRSWGFILMRDGYAPKRVTNTRDDKAYTKFWKDSFESGAAWCRQRPSASPTRASRRIGIGSR
jgi:putative SOS response-associated peptidase YedK